MPMHVTMVDPKGRECFAGSPMEVNDLLAQGYTLKGHADVRTSPPDPDAEEIAPVGDGGMIT